jgi:DNA processing protein
MAFEGSPMNGSHVGEEDHPEDHHPMAPECAPFEMAGDSEAQSPRKVQEEPKVTSPERRAAIELALVPGVGPRLTGLLMAHFGSAQKILQARRQDLMQVERIGPRIAEAIASALDSNLADQVIHHCRESGVTMLLPSDPGYPAPLRNLPDPPRLLFQRGEVTAADGLAIAIVGTRHPTQYGLTMAKRLACELVHAGFTVVSGLARGIDAQAHRAAMEAGGRTIAFLGSSVTDIYPPEHEKLACQVAQCGALISETHPFSAPRAGVFPQRNRLISGQSLGVVVVEAAERSGALITASHAGEQGRDVFAVPGPVTSRASQGPLQLLRDGAILVRSAGDIIEHLGPLAKPTISAAGTTVHHPKELQLNEQETRVLQAVGTITPTDIDQIIVQTQLEVPRVLATLSVLEMRGLIRRSGGRLFVRP